MTAFIQNYVNELKGEIDNLRKRLDETLKENTELKKTLGKKDV